MQISYVQVNLATKALYQPNHKFKDLYRYLRNEEWLTAAVLAVRDNEGAKTPGIDGIVLKELSAQQISAMVKELTQTLKEGTYIPSPVRRTYIPKQNGQLRPLGIPTAQDRVVQEVLRMILEPIYESVFLDCSFGFRPDRSTMDAIKRIQNYANEAIKMFWIVAGDIKGCFDNIPHYMLLGVLRNHIADERLLAVIKAFLQAGYVEDGRISRPNLGTPQGGIISPLLANIYLHEMDKVWWERYGGITQWEKYKRRKAGLGNVGLVRYADDFLLMTNGNKSFAYELKTEFYQVLAQLGLELSEEKTTVTHVDDGFDFLGFRIQRLYQGSGTSPKKALYITSTEKNERRYKERIQNILEETGADVVNKLKAVNAVSRGWANYYRHVQSSRERQNLTQWTFKAFEGWLVRKHRPLGKKAVYTMYYKRGGKQNWKTWVCQGIALHNMGAVKYKLYLAQTKTNPYLNPEDTQSLSIQDDEPVSGKAWRGTSAQNRYAIARLERMAAAGYRCEECGKPALPGELVAHHIEAQAQGGKHGQSNLKILCSDCHKETPGYGKKAKVETT